MSDRVVPQVLCVDKLQDGILITFKDGQCAVYSEFLLYAMLPQAQRVESDLVPETDD